MIFSLLFRNGPDPDDPDDPYDHDDAYLNAYLEHHDPCDFDRGQGNKKDPFDDDEDNQELLLGKSKIF